MESKFDQRLATAKELNVNRNSSPAFLLVAAIVLLSASSVYSGELEPSAPPAPTMTSLSEIAASTQSSESRPFEFFGTTTASPPDIGVLAMTRICHAEFGAGTRMCTSKEVLESANLPDPSAWNSPGGWVQPSVIGIEQAHFFDISGIQETPVFLTCDFWTLTNRTGLSVVAPTPGKEGQIAKTACSDATTGVACCGQVSP